MNELELEILQAANGGYWGKGDKEHTPEDWVSEVHQGNTRMGYWEWLDVMLRDE